MRKLLKIFGIVVAVLVVLVGAAVVIVPHVVDPNDYKAELATLVKERTGRDLRISGDIRLTVFPWLGVATGVVELGQPNSAGFSDLADTPFVRAERISVRVKLMPLVLSQRVEMDTVTAHGLTINLRRGADGRTNWADLIPPEPSESPAADGRALGALALGGLDLRRAALSWHDQVSGARHELENIALKTGAIDLARPIDVAVEFDVHSEDARLPSTVSGHVNATSRVRLEGTTQALALVMQALELSARLGAANGDRVDLGLSGELAVQPEARSVSSKRLKIVLREFGYAGTEGQLDLSTSLAADLGAGRIELGGVSSEGALRGAALAGGRTTFTAAGDVSLDLAAGTLKLRQFRAGLPALSAFGVAGSVSAASDVDADLTAQVAILAGLSASADLSADVPRDAGAFSVSGNLSGDSRIDLKRLVASSDALTLEVKHFDAAGYAGSLIAKSQLNVEPEGGRFHANGLTVDGVLTRGRVFAGELPFSAKGDLAVDLARDQLVTKGLELIAKRFDLDQASGTLRARATELSASLSTAKARFGGLRVETKVTGKSAFAGKVVASLQADGGFDPGTLTASAERFELTVPEFDVDGNQGTLSAKGQLRAHLARAAIELKGLTTRGRLTGAVLRGGRTNFATAGDIEYLGADQRFSAPQQRITLKGIEYQGFRGDLQVSGNVVGNTAKQVYSGKQLHIAGTLAGKPIPGKSVDLDVGVDGAVNVAQSTIRLSRIDAQAAGLHVTGDLNVSQFALAPAYEGKLRLAPFKPRPLLKRLGLGPITTADPAALSSLAAAAQVSGSPDTLSLTELSVTLDQSTIRGELSVASFARPSAKFNLVVNGIDADRYLPPAPTNSGAGSGAGSRGGKDSTHPAAIPFALLSRVDMDGQLRVGKLKLNNLRVSNARITAKSKDRQLSINPATANLYQGKFSGSVQVDARTSQPIVTTEQRLTGIQAGPLLTDLRGKAPLTGRADLTLNLSTSGMTDAALKRNANGTGRFSLLDGSIQGIDIVRTICGQLSNLGVVTAAEGGAAPETRFSALNGTVDIVNGLARNEDLNVVSPFLNITGAGTGDLATGALDYSLVSNLVDSCAGQGRGLAQNLVDVPIPIRVTGNFSRPTWQFDFERLLQTIASGQLQKQLSRVLGGRTEARDSPGAPPGPEEALKGILRGLFKQ